MRWLIVVAGLAGCRSSEVATSAGRVVIDQDGDTVVVRDTSRALELRLTQGSPGHRFVAVDLPETTMPGRTAIADAERDEAVAVWITRLGAKRPENIQRWFDERVDLARASSTVLADHGAMFGTHPARITDFVHHAKDHEAYERFIAIDVPEHDLDVVVIAMVRHKTPTVDQQAWLDAVTADARAMTVDAPLR